MRKLQWRLDLVNEVRPTTVLSSKAAATVLGISMAYLRNIRECLAGKLNLINVYTTNMWQWTYITGT
jgi:hypothetical protein